MKFSERIEQFDCIESEEWIVSDGAAKEYGRQDVAMTDGVGLEASHPLSGFCGAVEEPQQQGREGGDDQECFDAFSALGARIAQFSTIWSR